MTRLHAAVALAHWYIGQAALKIRSGHHDGAVTAMENADKFVSVIGREVAPDLEPLPESLRRALAAHGEDPDIVSVKSAEAWWPPYSGDPGELAEWFTKLAAATLRRLGVDVPPDFESDARVRPWCKGCVRLPDGVGGRCEECGTTWQPDESGTLQRVTL